MPRRKNISTARGNEVSGCAEKRSFSRALRKGMELPINTLVVVAIAVIVILAIAAFFMGGFGGSSKDMQNRQAFMNACSAWTQTGCAGNEPSDVAEKFKLWQPNTELSDVADEKTDFLAGMCGCFGRGVPGRTEKLCSDYTAADCPPSKGCELTKSCAGITNATDNGMCATSCPPAGKVYKQATAKYGCSNNCCIPRNAIEPTPPSACK